MIFQDRTHAALLLSDKLKKYASQHALVIAIPRGGVPVASVIAKQLDSDLNVVLVRKLGAPFNSEFAIGAVAESGQTYISTYAQSAGASQDYIDSEIAKQLKLIHHRRIAYDQVLKSTPAAGRLVIVVDDGLATGATMLAALISIQEQKPQKLICAIPVAPSNVLSQLEQYCDELICLHPSDDFQSVGQFYSEFGQVDDEEVLKILSEATGEDPSKRSG